MAKSSSSSKNHQQHHTRSQHKIILLVAVILVVAILGGYWLWQAKQTPEAVESSDVDPRAVQTEPGREGYLSSVQYAAIPDDASAEEKAGYLLSQADAAMAVENYELASERYLQALGVAGESANYAALNGLAAAYEAQGDDTRAKRTYERLLEVYQQADRDYSAAIKAVKQKLASYENAE